MTTAKDNGSGIHLRGALVPRRLPRVASPTLFAAVAVAFFLPFGTVSCDETVDFSGIELATYRVDGDPGGTLAADVESDGSFLALAGLAAAVAGLALGVVGRSGGGACASIGLIAMQLLLWSAALSLAEVRIRAGFWLASASLAGAAALHLVLAVGARRRSGRRSWPVALRGVAVMLPSLLLLALVGVALAGGDA